MNANNSQKGNNRRRNRGRGKANSNNNQAKNNGQGARQQKKKSNNNAGGRQQPSAKSLKAFWGDIDAIPEIAQVRVTPEPAAVVRSLGRPPIPGQEAVSEHYFTAIYDRAVALSGALAAAGGLIEPAELMEEIAAIEAEETR